ncbi:MAG: hypothetical protein JKX91_06340 [Rhizobiaceae bacterium]|nr:hypothetical protein [Rhizobiaceae bacterium]
MTDNIKHPAPLKTLREGGLAIVTSGPLTGRFVKLTREASYSDYKIIWRAEFHIRKDSDMICPAFNEDILMCVQNPYANAMFGVRKF